MFVKKHKNRNEYYYAGDGLWVRNFAKKMVQPIDINELIPPADMRLFLQNESENHRHMYQQVDTENFSHRNVLICGSGHRFLDEQGVLEGLKDVTVIGVNDTLCRWKCQARMHYYVVNNPYPDCLRFLPRSQRVWPRCVASRRTYPEFLQKYAGVNHVYEYSPVQDRHYSGLPAASDYQIDDYRNPVCAALGLAYRFGARKVCLFCCDDSFAEERPGSVLLSNGLHAYPQQVRAHRLIDGNLYWLLQAGVVSANCSDGPECVNAPYIKPKDVAPFFEGN